ncbi:MAG: Ig-like domain-containing protein, partial [Phycisphaerales bacterium]
MKTLFRILGLGAAMALAAPSATLAQTEPVLAAEITSITVNNGETFPGTYPLNESFGPIGSYITIEALARGTFPAGGFTYTFFVNGITIGQSTNVQAAGGGPGRLSWQPTQPGSYVLTVRASDGTHTVTTPPVRFFAYGTAMLSPTDNTIVPYGSSIVVQATAIAQPVGPNAFVKRVEFLADGVRIDSATDATYPYSFIFTPASTTPTTHVIEAQAYDNNENLISLAGTATLRVRTVQPIGTPPEVRIANPANGSSVQAGTAVSIITNATSASGFIKNVEFYVNGVWTSATQTFPFTATLTPQVPGKYTIVSIGYDDKGNAVSSEPIVLTATGDFPTVSIVDPPMSGMTVIQGSTVPITVRAAGAEGGVASLRTVEFLVNGQVNDSLPKAPPATGPGPAPAPGL